MSCILGDCLDQLQCQWGFRDALQYGEGKLGNRVLENTVSQPRFPRWENEER